MKNLTVQKLIDQLMEIPDKTKTVELRGGNGFIVDATDVIEIDNNSICILNGPIELSIEQMIDSLEKFNTN